MTDDKLKEALARIYRRDVSVEPKKAFEIKKEPVIDTTVKENVKEAQKPEPENQVMTEYVKEQDKPAAPIIKLQQKKEFKKEEPADEPKPVIKAPSKFTVSSNPHIKDNSSVKNIMWMVVVSLLPAAIAGVYFFKLRALSVIVLSVASAVATEIIINKLAKKPVTVHDGSAVITGLLMALILSPLVPWWIPVLGSIFAIAIAKLAFGGLGHNIFNPALAGRAFLVASFPALMTRWLLTDGVTGATPLGMLKEAGVATVSYFDLFIGNIGGCIGETSALAIILGGAFLLYKKIIDWRIPTLYIGTSALIAVIFGRNPLFHVLSGGLLLGAFFMATDYVTTPITKNGKLLFGFGCGFLTMAIRLWGGYPEGVMFSILLMNAFTPLIDRWTRPVQFGGKKR